MRSRGTVTGGRSAQSSVLAFELFLNTGQRRSDVVRMAWSHITAENKIVVVQQKTGRRLLIPLHRDLLTALAAAKRATRLDPHDDVRQAIHSGRLQSVDARCDHRTPGFRSIVSRTACAKRPVVVSQRRARQRKMIMSILGHTTFAEAERYTEEADQAARRRRCDQARRTQGEQDCPNHFRRFGKTSKKQRKIKVNKRDWRSLGDSNPCFRRERATSWAARRREQS